MRPLATRVTWRPGGPVCRGPKWTVRPRFSHTTAPGSPGLQSPEVPCGRRQGTSAGQSAVHKRAHGGSGTPGRPPARRRPVHSVHPQSTVHNPQRSIRSHDATGPWGAEKSGDERKDKQTGTDARPGPLVLAPQASSRSGCGKLEKDAEIARLIPIGCDCFCGLVGRPHDGPAARPGHPPISPRGLGCAHSDCRHPADSPPGL
jgi:hypothetical protein